MNDEGHGVTRDSVNVFLILFYNMMVMMRNVVFFVWQDADFGNVCITRLRSVSGPQPSTLGAEFVQERQHCAFHHVNLKKRFPLLRSGSFDKDNGNDDSTRSSDAIESMKHNYLKTTIKDATQPARREISFPHSKRTDFGRSRGMKLSGVTHTNREEAEKMLLASMADPSRISSDSSCLPVSQSQTENGSKCKTYSLDIAEEREKLKKDLFITSKNLQNKEDQLVKLDPKLGSQFERLVSAIDSVTNQMKIEFGGLNERIDCLQRSLEANHGSGWKSFIERLHHQRIVSPNGSCPLTNKSLTPTPSTYSHPLQGAIETARANIGLLSGLLIVEKDANLMHGRDFQDRHAMLLRMMKPYVDKPVFLQFWHMKHGVDHCVASVLLKTSHILARTINNSLEVPTKASTTTQREADQFNKFCKRGAKGLEEFAEWPEAKWSEHLKREFIRSCKAVWQLPQSSFMRSRFFILVLVQRLMRSPWILWNVV